MTGWFRIAHAVFSGLQCLVQHRAESQDWLARPGGDLRVVGRLEVSAPRQTKEGEGTVPANYSKFWSGLDSLVKGGRWKRRYCSMVEWTSAKKMDNETQAKGKCCRL